MTEYAQGALLVLCTAQLLVDAYMSVDKTVLTLSRLESAFATLASDF